MKSKLLWAIIGVALIVASLIWHTAGGKGMDGSVHKNLRIGYPGTWKLPLNPASQHMMIEDAILSNQFDSLLQRGENGLVLPAAAKSYEINDNFTIIDFQIDSSKRFSDGTVLTAQDFKRSWEIGLKLRENSANKNTIDALEPLVGFEDFNTKGEISGIEVVSQHHLRLRFKHPFRMALMHLTGARYAAFKEIDGEFLGTGRFKIVPHSEDHISLLRNPYFQGPDLGFDKIEILGLKDPLASLLNGEVDLIAYSPRKFRENEQFGATFGVEDYSGWFHLNGLPGRIFSDQKMRQAFQYLIFDILRENRQKIDDLPVSVSIDMQTYLPLQAGRISDREAEEIINRGAEFVDELIRRSKEQPIRISIYSYYDFIREALIKRGISLENKLFDSAPLLMADFYKEHTQDALMAGASVHLSDPDGIYHLLGKTGAISSPMIHRPTVTQLLEEGRSLTNQDEIVTHYEKVARAILEEVPSVHFCFISHRYIYRKDLLKVDQKQLERHFDQIFKVFHPVD